MAVIDQRKEQVGYLKLWQGIVIVTHFSLIGWLVSTSGQAADLPRVSAAAALVFLTVWGLIGHRRIEHHIAEIGKL